MVKKQKTRTSLINFVPAEWSIACEVTRDHAATSNATCDETARFTWLTGPRQLVLSGLLSSTEVCRAGRGDPPLPACLCLTDLTPAHATLFISESGYSYRLAL
ncbi:hypothetical protein RRG08_006136 [Elysia crispata]|uniref:Uncharacterized protein n=1 Tax=Elysia crispata TaxID=231223 RepID=A0AAE0Y2I9_9GAST|nr:hypothetical protein RRG08_006136 [Elysia crispata]